MFPASSSGAACVGIDEGVAVEVWCRCDVGCQDQSVLTPHCWGSAVAPLLGLGSSRAMSGFASHRLGILFIPLCGGWVAREP